MQKQLVAVTIPIYKKIPDANEVISLSQCLKVLNRHPVIFFAPRSLDVSFYENYCTDKVEFKIERFNDVYFADITGYNKLMLSKEFYYRFIEYKFVLIYQLDAFVFRDELEYWCKKEYDYIGAPYAYVDLDNYPIKFLSKYRALLQRFQKFLPGFYVFKQVGNGGLSLRNVKKALFLLFFKKLQPDLWTQLMEDNFFQYWGNLLFPFFKLPPVIEAAKFSIELDPQKTYHLIGDKLPFGCHAYMRYEPEFWKAHIE